MAEAAEVTCAGRGWTPGPSPADVRNAEEFRRIKGFDLLVSPPPPPHLVRKRRLREVGARPEATGHTPEPARLAAPQAPREAQG